MASSVSRSSETCPRWGKTAHFCAGIVTTLKSPGRPEELEPQPQSDNRYHPQSSCTPRRPHGPPGPGLCRYKVQSAPIGRECRSWFRLCTGCASPRVPKPCRFRSAAHQVAAKWIPSFWLGSFPSPDLQFPAENPSIEKSVCPSHLQKASEKCYCGNMPKKKPSPKWRSGCPLNASVEILGDRWSLLIIRDMMLRGFRTYKE